MILISECQVHYFVEGRIGDFVVNNPMVCLRFFVHLLLTYSSQVLGHESSGIISKSESQFMSVSAESDKRV